MINRRRSPAGRAPPTAGRPVRAGPLHLSGGPGCRARSAGVRARLALGRGGDDQSSEAAAGRAGRARAGCSRVRPATRPVRTSRLGCPAAVTGGRGEPGRPAVGHARRRGGCARRWPYTRALGFNGTSPGPTLRVRPGTSWRSGSSTTSTRTRTCTRTGCASRRRATATTRSCTSRRARPSTTASRCRSTTRQARVGTTRTTTVSSPTSCSAVSRARCSWTPGPTSPWRRTGHCWSPTSPSTARAMWWPRPRWNG